MADMSIFGHVAKSSSPYGRVTPTPQPGALTPSGRRGGLSGGAMSALGSMFDELNEKDNTEFLAQESTLLGAIKDAEDELKIATERDYGPNGAGQGNRFEIEHANTKYQGLLRNLEELRANPPEAESSMDRGLDSIGGFFSGMSDSLGDMFGIDNANSNDLRDRQSKVNNILNYWSK